jgi:hypothetical protein
MKISPKFLSLLGILCACVFFSQSLAAQVPYIQQLAFAGLLSRSAQGQFNGVQSDSSGNLYLLLDQKDGVRLIKSDSTASSIIAEALIGTDGDIGLALALDPGGNLYVTGTTTSGTLAATSGAAFPSPSDTSTNSFVAKFDANLNPLFITYAGSGRMAAASIAATATAVYITGSIFAPTLPVTPFGILQSPATGSTQNGFVEKFNSTGTTLQYATYLTGYGGNTAPSSIAVDPSGNAYVAGFTSASGYPTIAAVVPAIIPATPGATSGFLTRITPNGDGIAFSTFIPGAGITSLAYDPAANELVLSGQVSPGQFPIATVSTPLVPTAYQSVLRMSLDGSTVLTSTLLAPGTQSVVTPTPSGSVWVAGTLTSPLLPLPTLSTIGNSYAIRITPQGTIDQAARFGGEAANNPAFASAPVNFTGLTVDASSQPILAGSLNPTTSSNLLASQTFDTPLFNSPTAALPSTIQNAILTPGSCNGSECAGSAAYLAKLRTLAAAPSLAFSIDDSPNIILRNLGSTAAQNLTFNIVGFTQVSSCPTILPAGSDCSIALTGSGPGSISVQATNASTQTAEIPAMTALAAPITFSPRELDFGIQATSSPAVTRVITVTNLTQQSQTFTSALDVGTHAPASPFSEVSSDCATSGAIINKLLAPAGSCHITIALTAITDGPVAANWTIGTRDVVLAGYTQTASLSLSSAEINFGTQFASGLHLPRYLYLSNNSAASITHNAVSLPSSSPFTVADTCPDSARPSNGLPTPTHLPVRQLALQRCHHAQPRSGSHRSRHRKYSPPTGRQRFLHQPKPLRQPHVTQLSQCSRRNQYFRQQPDRHDLQHWRPTLYPCTLYHNQLHLQHQLPRNPPRRIQLQRPRHLRTRPTRHPTGPALDRRRSRHDSGLRRPRRSRHPRLRLRKRHSRLRQHHRRPTLRPVVQDHSTVHPVLRNDHWRLHRHPHRRSRLRTRPTRRLIVLRRGLRHLHQLLARRAIPSHRHRLARRKPRSRLNHHR